MAAPDHILCDQNLFSLYFLLLTIIKEKKRTLILLGQVQRRWCVLGFVKGHQQIPQFLVYVGWSIVICEWYNHFELMCPLSPFGDAQSLGNDHLSLLKIHFYNKLNLTKLIIMINLFNLQSNYLWWLCCPTLRYLYDFCWHVIVSVMCTL